MLSIIIINYNTFQLTVDCINSVKKATCSDYEIILIDNASRDRNPKDFLTVFPDIKLIELKENVGFGRANNKGMSIANGDYFLLLNSDTIIKGNAIDKCLNYMKDNLDIDILGCRTEFEDGTTQLTVFPYENEHSILRATICFIKRRSSILSTVISAIYEVIYFLKRNSILQCVNKLYKKQKNKSTLIQDTASLKKENTQLPPNYISGKKIGSLMGAFMMFKRKLYDETRGFDPDFFMYYEETEWFINRIYNKYNIVYYPDASIVHYCGKSDVDGLMGTQFWISSALFWYKISRLHLFIYSLFLIIDIPCNYLNYFISKDKKYIEKAQKIWTTIMYIPNIVKYNNSFNGRNSMLKIRV